MMRHEIAGQEGGAPMAPRWALPLASSSMIAVAPLTPPRKHQDHRASRPASPDSERAAASPRRLTAR